MSAAFLDGLENIGLAHDSLKVHLNEFRIGRYVDPFVDIIQNHDINDFYCLLLIGQSYSFFREYASVFSVF